MPLKRYLQRKPQRHTLTIRCSAEEKTFLVAQAHAQQTSINAVVVHALTDAEGWGALVPTAEGWATARATTSLTLALTTEEAQRLDFRAHTSQRSRSWIIREAIQAAMWHVQRTKGRGRVNAPNTSS